MEKNDIKHVYISTDTHFSHKKVIDFCDRPENYEELIWKGFQEIPDGSVLIHLGDVCMGDDEEKHQKYIAPLTNIKKILVKGNHDHKSNSWYLRNGWDFVCRQFKDKYFGKYILFSHMPQKDDGWYDINIHGHFHNTDHRSHEPELVAIKNDKQYLVAVEYTNYKPVRLETIINNITDA